VQCAHAWGPALSRLGAPLVSVVIPCFDSSRFLADAIDSVLSQTYPHVEIIVVDDGSHDNAAAIVRRYPGVIYLAQPNRGVAAARNVGLDRSAGSHIVFLDADDRLRPEAVEVGLVELARDPRAAFVSGQCVHIDDDGRQFPPVPAVHGGVDPYQELLRNCYIWTSAAVMFRRWVFQSIGGFDSALSHSADHDLFFRIAHRFKVGSHGRVVAEYRRHGGNMTRDAAASLRERMTVLRRQRPTVAHGPVEWRQAYREGIAFGRQYYGTPLIARVVSDIATGAWRGALHGFVTLLGCHRRGALDALVWTVRQIPLTYGARRVHEA
jgi:glycosyltransferase involved in cell wall biosynthesis